LKRQEAVVLSYLEWVRLIGTGVIRLDERRIVRWRPDRADSAEVVAGLMLGAPDLGTSATSFVLAMLEPEVLDRIRERGIDLGQRLNLDAVRSFQSFGDTALAVHRHDAEAAGVAIDLAPLAAGWAPWVEAVEAADRRARGEALLAMLDVPPCDRFVEATDRLAKRERCIAPDDIAHARDSMFFGWACVLNAQKVITGAAPILPADVKDEAGALRREFDVDQPFLARAPLLLAFVKKLVVEGDRPADLLAMASLKQHERYVIKREGAALDLPSLLDDIKILNEIEPGSAGFLVQALGERVPGKLIRALKARSVTRAVAPADAQQVDCAEVGLTPPPQLVGAPPPVERPMVPEAMGKKSAGGAVVAAAEAPTSVTSDAVSGVPQQVEAPLDPAPNQLGLDLDPNPLSSAAVSSKEPAASPAHQGRPRAVAAPKPKPRSRLSAPKTKKPKKKDQPSSSENR
jgi:hypothetical protein